MSDPAKQSHRLIRRWLLILFMSLKDDDIQVITCINIVNMEMSELDCMKLDELLKMFDGVPGGVIEKSVLYHTEENETLPSDYDKALAFLTAEGYLGESKYGFTITFKGRAKLRIGGFLKEQRIQVRERRLERLGIIVGVVTGIMGLLLSIVALLT